MNQIVPKLNLYQDSSRRVARKRKTRTAAVKAPQPAQSSWKSCTMDGSASPKLPSRHATAHAKAEYFMAETTEPLAVGGISSEIAGKLQAAHDRLL